MAMTLRHRFDLEITTWDPALDQSHLLYTYLFFIFHPFLFRNAKVDGKGIFRKNKKSFIRKSTANDYGTFHLVKRPVQQVLIPHNCLPQHPSSCDRKS